MILSISKVTLNFAPRFLTTGSLIVKDTLSKTGSTLFKLGDSGKLLHPFVPQFPHLKWGQYLLLRGLNERCKRLRAVPGHHEHSILSLVMKIILIRLFSSILSRTANVQGRALSLATSMITRVKIIQNLTPKRDYELPRRCPFLFNSRQTHIFPTYTIPFTWKRIVG